MSTYSLQSCVGLPHGGHEAGWKGSSLSAYITLHLKPDVVIKANGAGGL